MDFVKHSCRIVVLLLLSFLLAGCGSLITSKVQQVTDDITLAIKASDDIATVQAGMPAYLLLTDGLIQSDPTNADLLAASADMYVGYAATFDFTNDPQRAKQLTKTALKRAFRAACLSTSSLCDLQQLDYNVFVARINQQNPKKLPILWTLGTAWSSWLQARSGDWDAIADIPRIRVIMEKILELDESYNQGQAHLYLGVLDTLLPKAMGGKLESGRAHFERVIELTNGDQLMAKVFYAKQYARLTFDQKLHDRLLREVRDAQPSDPTLTLSNTIAKQQAELLLRESADYFL